MTEEKIDSLIKLNNKFLKIQNLGFVNGINDKSKGNAGITFEKLLGKENDNFQTADYNEIEIKVKNESKTKLLRLFSLVPSNSFGIELKRIRNTYGINDKQFKGIKTLQSFLGATKKSIIISGYKLQLEIDYIKEKLYLLIYDKNDNILEKKIYWDFDDLIKIIERKLKTLAIIKFETKKVNGKNQFHYTSINYYKIKSTVVFFKLIELGKIKINIDLGIYRSGLKIGKEHDNGIFFYINYSDLFELYEEIYL